MKSFNKLILPLIVCVVVLCSSNIQWGKNSWKDIIEADGKGYYAYLPAAFIYHDLNFSFFDSIEKKYPNPAIYYDYRVGKQNKKADKYFVGTAIAMSPFFLIAHLSSDFFGYEADGYSRIYPVMVNVAAIFYLFLGLYYLKKLLGRYGSSDSLISFILIAITFATNVFYYTVCEPAMSHIYSFAFITMLLYYLHQFFTSPKAYLVLILALIYGIIILIRPVNGLIMFIAPFISGNKDQFLKAVVFLRSHFWNSLFALMIFISIIFFQLLVYKIQTGSFWIDSYGAEKFNWNDAHPFRFLFSYKKGLFVYTPLALIGTVGFFRLIKLSKFQFYSLILFLILLLYVLSSWWNWWYGGSFSSRVSVEYYSILAILIHFSYQMITPKLGRWMYSCLIVFCLLICQIQTYQYRYYFIHWEKMDQDHYWKVFLRVDLLGKVNPNADLLKE
jgi:hypothetical protein